MRRIRRKHSERGGALQVILAVIGGLVVLAVLAVLVGLWAVKHYVQVEVDRSGDTKRVAVRTPIGDIEVQKAEEIAAQLKLPVYPGAEPADEGASVRLRGRLWAKEGGIDVVAAEFRTGDPFDDVDAWYGKELGAQFTRKKGRIVGGDDRGDDHGWRLRVEPGGNDVVYSQEREGRLRGVVLKRHHGDVKIGLFDVAEARRQ